MTAAGLEHAVELAELAMEETQARAAFGDACVRTNSRIPLLRELVELLRAGYEGR
jgi:hypothetical protein